MLVGYQLPPDFLDDDFAYVVDLGLITTRRGFAEIANPIYREVIPRALTYVRQMSIAHDPAFYVRPDGGLDLDKLLRAFQTFWRKAGFLHDGQEGRLLERAAGEEQARLDVFPAEPRVFPEDLVHRGAVCEQPQEVWHRRQEGKFVLRRRWGACNFNELAITLRSQAP
jgi:hypothetical protein